MSTIFPGDDPTGWINFSDHKYSKEEVEKIAQDAVDKTAENWKDRCKEISAEWKEFSQMLDIKKGALEDAIKAAQNGQISINEDELHPFFRKKAYERAEINGFDLDKAEERFAPNVKK